MPSASSSSYTYKSPKSKHLFIQRRILNAPKVSVINQFIADQIWSVPTHSPWVLWIPVSWCPCLFLCQPKFYCDITKPSPMLAQSLAQVTATLIFVVCLETDYCTCIPPDHNILILCQVSSDSTDRKISYQCSPGDGFHHFGSIRSLRCHKMCLVHLSLQIKGVNLIFKFTFKFL